jgi:hypothetical protein
MKNLTLFIYLLFSFLIFNQAFSQNIVVSEYHNVSNTPPDGEWTELLVIDDNTSAVGLILRDNTGTNNLTDWMGGIKFKDLACFKNLRRGTIILINHRLTGYIDDNSSDGYLELDATNETYFEKMIYCTGCDLSSWATSALNIAQEGEIIQLMTSSGVNVHTLAHMNTPKGDWISIPAPKTSWKGTVGNGGSIRIVPGRNLSEYNMDFDNTGAYTNSSTIHSKGKPNTSTAYPAENYKFWHTLRKPDWNSPTVSGTATISGVDLSWNKMEDNYPTDNTQGYLILRIQTDLLASATRPVDGKVYNKGDKLGSAEVVDNVFPSTKITYSDNFTFDCGKSFTYRIYAFRYSADLLGDDATPENQRGRIYNSSVQFPLETSFAESKAIEKPAPEKPILSFKSGKVTFCKGDRAILTFAPKGTNNTFEWYKDDAIVNGQTSDTLPVFESGFYFVKVKNSINCEKSSDKIEVKVVDQPKAKIGINYNYVKKDSSIIICKEAGALLMTVAGGEEFIYLKNNKIIRQDNVSTINITESGNYKVVAVNQKICFDTSFTISVKFLDVNFTVEKKSINYTLSKSEFSKDDSVKVTNLSSDTLFLNNVNLNAYFEIVSPNKPYIVNPNSVKTFIVRFKTTTGGTFEDILRFSSDCNKKDSVSLKGDKPSTGLTTSLAEVVYPNILSCSKNNIDTTFKISNTGQTKLTVLKPLVNLPFEILSPAFPVDLEKGTSLDLNVRFNSANIGNFSDYVKIPFVSLSENDTIKIFVSGRVILPEFKITNDNIDFGNLKTCNESIDTVIVIENPNEIDIEINSNPSADFKFNQAFPIVVKAKDKLAVRVTIQIKTSGSFNQKYTISAEPCSMKKEITFFGTKTGMVYQLDKDTIDFGNIIVNCSNPEIKRKFVLTVSDVSQKPRLKSWLLDNFKYFTHNLDKTYELNASNEFEVVFKPESDGTFIAALKLRLEPCDIEKVIYLKGSRETFDYKNVDSLLSFGSKVIPVSETQSFKLENKSKITITISGIDSVKAPFSYDKSQFPITLKSGENKSVNFFYNQTKVSNDSQRVFLSISNPCPGNNFPIILKGSSFDNGYAVEFSIDDHKGNVGENVLIPVIINSKTAADISKIEFKTIDAYISYNASILFPLSVEGIQSTKIKSNEIKEKSPGHLMVKTVLNSGMQLENGKLYNLKFKVLNGDTSYTKIKIDSVITTSDKTLIISKKDGSFTVILGEIFGLNNVLDIKLKTYSPELEDIVFALDLPYDDKLDINFYNSIGQLAKYITLSNFSGTRELKVNVSDLPFGAYYVEFTNGVHRRIVNITIVR